MRLVQAAGRSGVPPYGTPIDFRDSCIVRRFGGDITPCRWPAMRGLV